MGARGAAAPRSTDHGNALSDIAIGVRHDADRFNGSLV